MWRKNKKPVSKVLGVVINYLSIFYQAVKIGVYPQTGGGLKTKRVFVYVLK